MYADGLSFLEEEREAWQPYEELLGLTDEQLQATVEGAHGWTGRDLMGHLCAWIERWLEVARELAVNPESPALARLQDLSRDWEAQGEAVNAAIQAEWSALPMSEVRRRFEAAPGELRGYLTVVPETRWLKNAERLASLTENTMGHYDEHMAELKAILAAAGR
jgi:hypothetical protein